MNFLVVLSAYKGQRVPSLNIWMQSGCVVVAAADLETLKRH